MLSVVSYNRLLFNGLQSWNTQLVFDLGNRFDQSLTVTYIQNEEVYTFHKKNCKENDEKKKEREWWGGGRDSKSATTARFSGYVSLARNETYEKRCYWWELGQTVNQWGMFFPPGDRLSSIAPNDPMNFWTWF